MDRGHNIFEVTGYICSLWMPQFIVTKGHNILKEASTLAIELNKKVIITQVKDNISFQ